MNSPSVIAITAGILLTLFAISWALMRAVTHGRGVRMAAKVFWAFLLWNILFLATMFIMGSELDQRGKLYDMADNIYISIVVVYAWMFYISPILLLLLAIWYLIARRQPPKQKHRSRKHSS